MDLLVPRLVCPRHFLAAHGRLRAMAAAADDVVKNAKGAAAGGVARA
jgi:hypothetical protein